MSVPFGGAQPAVPQHHSPGGPKSQNLGLTLALVAAGLGLVSYACSFSDDAFAAGVPGLVLPLLLGGGLLAGANALPNRPNTLLPATLLAALGTLILLLIVIKSGSDIGAIVVVILIAGLLELAACAIALLMDSGMIRPAPRAPGPQAYAAPAGGWSAQPSAYPQPGYGTGPGAGYGQPLPYGQQYGGPPVGGGQQGYGQGAPGGHGGAGVHSGHSAPGGLSGPGGQGGQGGPGGSGGQGGQGGQGGGPQHESRSGSQFGQQPYGQQPYGGGGGQGQAGSPPGGF